MIVQVSVLRSTLSSGCLNPAAAEFVPSTLSSQAGPADKPGNAAEERCAAASASTADEKGQTDNSDVASMTVAAGEQLEAAKADDNAEPAQEAIVELKASQGHSVKEAADDTSAVASTAEDWDADISRGISKLIISTAEGAGSGQANSSSATGAAVSALTREIQGLKKGNEHAL